MRVFILLLSGGGVDVERPGVEGGQIVLRWSAIPGACLEATEDTMPVLDIAKINVDPSTDQN